MNYKKVFLNGNVYTVDKNIPFAEAIITVNDKIVFVGSNESAKQHVDNFTEVIDLKGKLVLPGFIDSHAHTILGGFSLLSVDLRHCKTKDEFILTLKKFSHTYSGNWITGGNWNHQIWDNPILPTKEWIDEFTNDIPVFLTRMDYHMALANSKALELAGIDNNAKNPDGGIIVKDTLTGEPTGILKDKAMELVLNVIPEPSEKEYSNSVDAAMMEASRNGVTGIGDITYKNHFIAFQKAKKENKLTCRINAILPIQLVNEFIANEIQTNFGDEYLKIGSLKAFADGSLGSSTAYFFDPYLDDETNFGLPMDILSNGKLAEMMVKADKYNLQLCIHAIGDKAVSDVIDIVERIKNENKFWDRRLRIEHAQHIHPKDYTRFKNLDIIISAQPYHLYDDGPWAGDLIGYERMKNTLAFRSILDNNIKLCFGSDWAVAPLKPLLGIYAATTRQTCDGKYPDGINPEQKISVHEAIKAYTIDAAFANNAENYCGSITTGKKADFIVLSDNILDIDPNQIKNTTVEKTIFDGDIVYNIE
jgi:predicted amidohydrolase YtcJ